MSSRNQLLQRWLVSAAVCRCYGSVTSPWGRGEQAGRLSSATCLAVGGQPQLRCAHAPCCRRVGSACHMLQAPRLWHRLAAPRSPPSSTRKTTTALRLPGPGAEPRRVQTGAARGAGARGRRAWRVSGGGRARLRSSAVGQGRSRQCSSACRLRACLAWGLQPHARPRQHGARWPCFGRRVRQQRGNRHPSLHSLTTSGALKHSAAVSECHSHQGANS